MNPPETPDLKMPPCAQHWSERAGLWGYMLFVSVFGIIMGPRISNIAGGADPSCYLELSRCFMEGSLSPPLRPVASLPLESYAPGVYAPISFAAKPDYSGLTPTGFTGLPLLYSLFDVFLPTPLAISTVGWITLMGCGVIPFLLLREIGLGNAWAAFGGITLGLSPLVVLIGSVPMTDPSTCCMATLCWLLAFRARRGTGWALALGFALGFAVLVRLSNVLLFPAVGAVLLVRGWKTIPWLAIIAGGAPAAVFLITYNNNVSAVAGYGNLPDLLHTKHMAASLRNYLHWIPVLYLPVALAMAPFSLLLMRREGAFVVSAWLLIVAYVGFYACYFASSETWYILRYIMPAIVAIVACSILVLQRCEKWAVQRWHLSRMRGTLPVVLAIASVAYGAYHGNRLRAYDFRKNESVILEVVEFIGESTRTGDAFLCFNFSGSMHYYTDKAFLRHDQLDRAGWVKLLQAIDGENVYGIFYAFEMGDPDTVASKFPGKWQRVFATHDTAIHVFQLNR